MKSKEPYISDWNKDINPSRKQFRRFDLELLAERYPEVRLGQLGSLLKHAEAIEQTPLLKIVRAEYTLLEHSARCATLFWKGMKERTAENAESLMNAVWERSEYINSLPADEKGTSCLEDVILYGGVSKDVIKIGGRLNCLFNAPFHWNLETMKKEHIIPFGRILVADGRDTQYLVPMCVDDRTPPTVKFERTVQVCARQEDSRLILTLVGRNLNQENRDKLRIRIKLGPNKGQRHQMFGAFSNGALSDSVQDGFIKDPHICGQQEKWVPSSALRPSVKCPTPDTAEIAIPLDKYGKLPEPGEKWLFNVAVYVPNRVFAGGLVWECALDHLDWQQAFEQEGTLLFPKRK